MQVSLIRRSAIAALLLAGAATARAADTASSTPVTAATSSRVWLSGDSTLHPYAATSTVVTFKAVFDNAIKPGSKGLDLVGASIRDLKVEVPVKALKSGEKGLDKNIRKALKEDVSPLIVFEASGTATIETQSGIFLVKMPGRLTIGGATREATVAAELRAEDGGIHGVGRYDLRMSDFGIRPPTILGMIKVRDAVTVGFDLTLTPEASTAAR